MNNRGQLSYTELLMGRMAALIESPFEPSEDYVERYKRVTDMSLDQDTVKNLNNLTPEQHRKVRNIIRWQRIGCIVVKISETLCVSLKEALDIFTGARPVVDFMMRRQDFIFREICMSRMTSWQRFLRDSVPGAICTPHRLQ